MIKFGIINNTEPATGRVRVHFPDDGITSHWIPVLVSGSSGNQFFHSFAVNEPVVCLMDLRNEDGVCLGAIYSGSIVPDLPSDTKTKIKFSDNTVVQYDTSTSTLTVDVSGSKIIASSQGIEVSKGGDSLGDIMSDLMDAMSAETHNVTAIGAPSGPPLNIASYIALKARLNLLLQ